MTIYAYLTATGTAASETAVCHDHIARAEHAADTVGSLTNCSGNEALSCVICGATADPLPLEV